MDRMGAGAIRLALAIDRRLVFPGFSSSPVTQNDRSENPQIIFGLDVRVLQRGRLPERKIAGCRRSAYLARGKDKMAESGEVETRKC